ncbi:MFS general substrate transporter [Aspergillus steynii IBT 23096]|uniref:MFS general substrate transporter n=1 Tax=Aspergillus steynii IBT 23096 TaxID=1392250 RepID=A0A2I2G007_9EURO|nr:MFS general substrate transporter [Aspergillus steynii IBT 23096]PLB46210.1 MFS general substrate transporter [Aspergillus steynii IBT 23096]
MAGDNASQLTDITPTESATKQLESSPVRNAAPEDQTAEASYSALPYRQKLIAIAIASLATFVSPMSASIYYPGIEAVASDLRVSTNMINLTMTSFKICQGIAPLVTGGLSDQKGRRWTLIVSLFLYIDTNVAIALQPTFAGLLVLRSFQSIFSSSIAIVGSAITADVASGAERGKYMAYTILGATVGPALGPAVGGVLIQFFGWRSTLWALAIFAFTILTAVLILLPETCRAVVGNGSILPPKWNRPVSQLVSRASRPASPQYDTLTSFKAKPGPWNTLKLMRQKETAATICFSAIMYSGYISITTTLPFELGRHYRYNNLQIGLCYLAYGGGSFAARWTAGPLTDWNFRRLARRLGFGIFASGLKKYDLVDFPLEKARLQVAFPFAYMASIFVVAYGWVLEYEVTVAASLVMLFCIAHALAGITSTLTTLIVDFHPGQPASASAAANFFRCMLGAGTSAAGMPLINRTGVGWAGNILAFIFAGSSPLLWTVYIFGNKWRRQRHSTE